MFERFDMDMDRSFLHLFGQERMDDIHFLSTTSGTTGVPTPYPFFHKTFDLAAELFGRVGWRAGFVPGTKLALLFGLSMHVAGIPQVFWFSRLRGVTVLNIGAEVGTERILKSMKLFGANAMTCTPSLATYLIEKCPEVLGHPVGDLGVKVLLLGAEPGAGIPEMRARLEEAYGADGAGRGRRATAVRAPTPSTRACTGSPTTTASTSWSTRSPTSPCRWRTAPAAWPASRPSPPRPASSTTTCASA